MELLEPQEMDLHRTCSRRRKAAGRIISIDKVCTRFRLIGIRSRNMELKSIKQIQVFSGFYYYFGYYYR
jgi:hypothetical protein